MSTNAMVAELRALLRLTETEIAVAELRRTQATTRAVERELAQNADNARSRRDAIAGLLRERGGVPDVFSLAAGRLTAAVKGQLDQAQPLSEALLGDLALEHQLHDRSRRLKALAAAGSDRGAEQLSERLERAHAATIEWLTTVVAQDAMGGPSALAPTTLQRLVGVGLRTAAVPVSLTRDTAERLIDSLARTGDAVQDRAGSLADTVAQTTETAAGTASAAAEAARRAALAEAQTQARRRGARRTARTLEQVRSSTGALGEDELPVEGYDKLTQPKAVAAVKKLEDVEQVRAVMAYEQAHKNRPSVVSAAQARSAELAQEVLGPS